MRAVVVVSAVTAVFLCSGAACPQARPRLPRGGVAPILFQMPQRPVCADAYDDAVDVAALTDPALREISGLATSLKNEGLAWALADAGNAAAVVAVDVASGESRLTVALPVENVDFEDLSLAPCPDLAGPCVYVADTGDNDADRDVVFLYAFPEPVIEAATPAGTTSLDFVWTLPLTYDAGPVDVEAVVVAPDATAILLFEKTSAPVARIFLARAPWVITNAEGTTPGVALQSGTVTLGDDDAIAGAALHWSGTRLVLRGRSTVVEFAAANPDGFVDLAGTAPRVAWPAPDGEGGRGEAVTFSADGVDVLSAAEADVDEVPVLRRTACE